jgi:dTDP-4-amino-4,6-dideoxygalactose transaminase
MTMMVPTPASRAPAILGGDPLFASGLPLARPSVPDAERITAQIRRILDSGVLTNGPYVRDLEDATEAYLGVRHCVAVSSCTSGLMLLLRAADLSGDVVLPSFTFAATAHAVAWNGLRPVFADVDAETLTLSPVRAAHATGMRTSAILATHLYGAPCDVDALTDLAHRTGVRLFFDAAHALGARHGDDPVGRFGHAEVFSLSPTKPVIAGEGGIIATNDDDLAERCRIGRDYANPGDYDCLFVGLNARMSELHAALALASLDDVDKRILRRNELAGRYRDVFASIPGISFPRVAEGDVCTYKDFTIVIEPDEFGLSPDRLGSALAAEGIDTRRYYSPPVHRMKAYRSFAHVDGALSITDAAAGRVLTLPMFDEMSDGSVEGVAQAVRRIRDYRAEVANTA